LAALLPYSTARYKNEKAGGHLPAVSQGVEALTNQQKTPPALYDKAGLAFLLFQFVQFFDF